MEPKTFLFFGSPGSGKSTQAKAFAEALERESNQKVFFLRWSYIRDEFFEHNENVREKLQENHTAGKLQPKFLSTSIWGPVLLKQLQSNQHLVIEGIPRQTFEAQALDSAFDFFNRTEVTVLNMTVDRQIAIERIKQRALEEGRVDDANDTSIGHRLAWFDTDTLPILEMYKYNSRYTVININAEEDYMTVQKELHSIFQHQGDEQEQMLVMTVGMPGSGKTTLIKPFADTHGLTYVSRDAIRKKMFGDPLIQANKDLVWNEANQQVQYAFVSGKSLVYDATFAEQEKRNEFIMLMRSMGWKKIIGLYVNTPFDVAKERNLNREHVVPESELEKFFIGPLTANPPSLDDGFDELYTLENLETFKLLFS